MHLEEEESAMTRIWKVVVGAFLAAISVSALASEPNCTADVCNDPTWGEMRVAAPAIRMEVLVTDKLATRAVNEGIARDELAGGSSAAVHTHFECPGTAKAAAATVNERLTRDETAAGCPDAAHVHPAPVVVASAR